MTPPRQAATVTLPPPGATVPPAIDTAVVAPVAVPTPRELAADPSRFEGLAADAVLTRLGDPNFRHRDPPAEVWQYYGDKCILDLFLYDDEDSLRVAHAEVRSRTAGDGSGCLVHMLAARHS